jgi:hypothetical protein
VWLNFDRAFEAYLFQTWKIKIAFIEIETQLWYSNSSTGIIDSYFLANALYFKGCME